MASPRSTGTLKGFFLLAALAGLWAWWQSTVPVTAPEPASVAQVAADAPRRFPDTEFRTSVAIPEAEQGTTVEGAELDFATLLEQLVELAVAATADAESREPDKLRSLEEQGKVILHQIQHRIDQPDAQALYTLTGLMSEDETLRGTLRRKLCVGLIEKGLRRKLAVFEHGGSRTQLDELVGSLLSTIPQDEILARDIGKLLTGTPYLGIAHENAVFDLLATATADRYLIPVVTGILETLWKNLRASGARTDRELINLALLFREEANPAKRLAALRHLMTVDDGRYRELVIQEAIAKSDDNLVAELTMTAASELPPREALTTLERLSTVTTRQLMAAFMTLGSRQPRLLVDAYEQKLADGIRADYRAELVTGAGFQGGSAGLSLARTAFEHDPDLDVRVRAMFVISGQSNAAEAEKTLMAALDDPAFAEDPHRLSDVVLAIPNLATKDDPNAVARVVRRLMGNGALLASDRRKLERVLAQTLPAGRARK